MSPTLSLCIIVRDEAERLDRAIRSAEGGFDELVVVDTGSRDHTRDVARAWGARVVDFTSANAPDGTLLNFAAARNVALAHATGEYWWWIDADEIAAPGTPERLRTLAAQRPAGAVLGVTRRDGSRWLQPRLAPRNQDHFWVGAVHEWLRAPAIGPEAPDVIFDHGPRPERGAAPLVRNLKILQHELAEGRATSREYFYAACTLDGLGWGRSAVRTWNAYLSLRHLDRISAGFARLYRARLCFRLGDVREAARGAIAALATIPKFAEAACLLGDIAAELRDALLAARWYGRALTFAPCPLGPLFHEPACYGPYPESRLTALFSQR